MVYRRYTQLGQKAEFETVATEQYAELSTRTVFTNPILLLLNLVHQFEKTFTLESMRDRKAWSRTQEEWKDWIELSPKLKHLVGQHDLDTVTNESHSSVNGLACALAVAGHLRRRLPPEFHWVIEKPDDDSDVFSDPSTSYPPSQHCASTVRRGSGSHSPKEDRLGGGGSGSGRGIFDIQAGKKRKQAEERTDCTDMVKEWQKQNSEPRSFWRNVRLSWKSNRPKRNGSAGVWLSQAVQSGIRPVSFRKIFANRTS